MNEYLESIWKPIEFNDLWRNADTSKFDDLAPSWYNKRKEFKEDKVGYEEFLVKLKRQHAIETGVVERLYNLDDGVTQTLIKNGFIESLVSHKDTDVTPSQLMSFLGDHLDAVEFVYDVVSSMRPISIGFIKELHQLITKHQDYTEAVDTLNNVVQMPLIKGQFKQYDNNPKRQDGTIYCYCPPIHVEQEVENLIKIYEKLVEENVSPIITAAWVHHAFTQIHPFQDGNGRIGRLLSSLILIKSGLLPFTVKRADKVDYINALEKADYGEPQELVSFFASEQKKSIEAAVNFKAERKYTSFDQLADLFNEKVNISLHRAKEKRQRILDSERQKIFDSIKILLDDIRNELKRLIPTSKATIRVGGAEPNNEDKYYYHTRQIVEYAQKHDYYFNKLLPRGWFVIYFTLPNGERYDLILSVHHYGYDDDIVAVGGFLEFLDNKGDDSKITIPINLPPFTISLESMTDRMSINLSDYIKEVIRVALSIIINEIN